MQMKNRKSPNSIYPPRGSIYHENVINAGFRAIGSNKCEAATVAMGKMATKSVMCQLYGMNGAVARMIMPTIKVMEKSIENLNCKRHH